MFRVLKHIIATVLLLGLASCADDTIFCTGLVNGEQSVEFTFTLPDATQTRAIANPKTSFKEGDMIHIEGEFNMKDSEETVVRYGALRYGNNGKWNAVEGSELTWPNLATNGKFKAYYVAIGEGYKGGLLNEEGDNGAILVSLSDVATDGDPLHAESKEDIPYGHAVALTFRHLCTYLTLNYLEPMVANSYWFTRKQSGDTKFNNAFKLELVQDKENKTRLIFAFCQKPDDNFLAFGSNGTGEKGLVYISSAVSEFRGETNGTGARTTYFLEPERYENFSLVYKLSDSEYIEYLQYDFSRISESEDNPIVEPDFKAGKQYVLDINKSGGIIMTTPADGNEKWDDNGKYYDVDVEQFLRAARNSKDYYYNEGQEDQVHILQATATGVKLLENVDFKGKKYDIFSGPFEPNITGGQTFDGDYHYIQHLGSPLFYSNSGTIKNLGIKGIKIENIPSDETATSEENPGGTFDMSRIGGLCRRNMETGVISNVHISDGVEISAKVKTYKDGNIEDGNGNTQGNETHNIGGVAGSNVGKIEDVELSGSFTVTVSNHADAKSDLFAQINIGGIVGQNGANGLVSGVKPLDGNLSVSVTNKCSGNLAAFYVGGIVGSNSGYLSDIIVPELKIDGTQSMGLTSYIGGVAGDLSTNPPTGSNGNFVYAASVSSCIVSGSVKGGNVKPYKDLTCAIMAGGIAGATLHTPVTDCRVAVSVDNSVVDLSDKGVICATGGAIGRIRKEGDDLPTISDIIAYGDELKGAVSTSSGSTAYTGSFAGLVPDGMSWSDFSSSNIIVKGFSGISEIGGTMQ